MKNEITFPEGTRARCNRNCAGTYPLPRETEGFRENSNAYRLQGMCILECGHMDAHWVFLSDNPELREEE